MEVEVEGGVQFAISRRLWRKSQGRWFDTELITGFAQELRAQIHIALDWPKVYLSTADLHNNNTQIAYNYLNM